jgi:hypothetical protein
MFQMWTGMVDQKLMTTPSTYPNIICVQQKKHHIVTTTTTTHSKKTEVFINYFWILSNKKHLFLIIDEIHDQEATNVKRSKIQPIKLKINFLRYMNKNKKIRSNKKTDGLYDKYNTHNSHILKKSVNGSGNFSVTLLIIFNPLNTYYI